MPLGTFVTVRRSPVRAGTTGGSRKAGYFAGARRVRIGGTSLAPSGIRAPLLPAAINKREDSMRKAMKTKRKKSKGFTLIELLVVVAIVGILAAIAIPQFAAYRARGFNARVSSDARNAATAQEGYFVDNNAYFSGSCSGLPGFTLSSGVVCTTAGTATDFTVNASHPSATKACVWTSNPGSGTPNLVCS
jgi:prepilin-type N-terminal cleavage/methylation domain-containing protein